jgi:hypothetical protein
MHAGSRVQLLRRWERLRLPAGRRDQQLQRLADRHVVIDHEHDGRRARHRRRFGLDASGDSMLTSGSVRSSRVRHKLQKSRPILTEWSRILHAQCGIERVEQGRLAEGLEHALHGASREQALAQRLVPLRGDEDDRDR